MDRVLQRRDTAANWSSANPVLAEGELGIITDTKGYKIGDGSTAWNNLEYPANPTQVVNELGNSETAAISQKIVSDNIENLTYKVVYLEYWGPHNDIIITLSDGVYYYNTYNHKIGFRSSGESIEKDPSKNNIYLYDNRIYYWNGESLVNMFDYLSTRTDNQIIEVIIEQLLTMFSTNSSIVASSNTQTSKFLNQYGELQDINDSNYSISEYEITEGNIYRVKGYIYSGNSLFCVKDENDITLYTSRVTSSNIYERTFIAPKNAKKLLVSTRTNTLATQPVFELTISSNISEDRIDGLISSLSSIYTKGEGVTATETKTGYFLNSSGLEQSIENENQTVSTFSIDPTKIYITEGACYYNNSIYVLLDSQGNIIQNKLASLSGTNTYQEIVFPPSNAVSIKVESNAYFVPASLSVATVNISSSGGDSGIDWSNKKWVCVGDSLTESNSRTTKNYHDYIAESTGISVVNMGVGGTGYKRTEEDNTAFYQRISSVPTDADVITIFGSGNDMKYELGNITDTGTYTLCGCINTTLDNLFSVFPLANVALVTPTPWVNYPTTTENNKMKLYSEAIKNICERRGIPCLDLYSCSSLRPWEESYRELAYSKDSGNGVHPDETGHKIIAPRFKTLLESLIL